MGGFGSVFDLFLLILFDFFAGVDMSSVSRGGMHQVFLLYLVCDHCHYLVDY